MIQIATFNFKDKRIIIGLDETTKAIVSSDGYIYKTNCKNSRSAFRYVENHFSNETNFSWLADYDSAWGVIPFPNPTIERILAQ